ncbi:MAG: 50S ribosomal protein L24e [Nanoarchaeota archaeon]
MAKCSFCGTNLKPGFGMMYIKVDGKILYFCSSKCRKNMIKLNRKPIKFKWTMVYKKE